MGLDGSILGYANRRVAISPLTREEEAKGSVPGTQVWGLWKMHTVG